MRISVHGTEKESFCRMAGNIMAFQSHRLWLPHLRACNLGYRAKYIHQAALDVADGQINLSEIQSMSYKKAREALMEIYGVGGKVADCICLFALHQLDAFPVDTHIRQVLDQHYKRGFPNRRYKGMRGVMQQYIFYYELTGIPSGDK